MANTLTGLIQPIYATMQVLSRELVGFIPSVDKDAVAEKVALNQPVVWGSSDNDGEDPYDIVPGATPPALKDTVYNQDTMTITKARAKRFYWTGDDQKRVESGLLEDLHNNKILNNMRKLTNEIEADLAALYVYASRAYGTGGTTPFATAGDWTDLALLLKILKDNGAPLSDLRLVVDTTVGANLLGKQSRVDLIGSQSPLRQGVIENRMDFQIRESAGVKVHTKGTGSGYLVNDATDVAVGDTDIVLDTGTGTVLPGDIVDFAAAGTYNYVVGTGVAAPGTITLNNPGVRQAIADDAAMTIANGYTANMAFAKSAIRLLSRLPLTPDGGDMADDEMVITDPVSGIPFRVALYRGYHANQIEVSTAWGVKVAQPEHIALLLG